jgi:hypothetical protein
VRVDLETSEVAFEGILACPVTLRRPPAKTIEKPPPYAIAYANVLPESHREALRDAAIAYLDECFSAIADCEPGQSYANTPSGTLLNAAARVPRT